MKKKWASTLLTGLIITALAGPAVADTIKLGVPGAHSSDLASYGLPTANAAKLVAKQYNEKGGILGMQVEVITQDDQCKPELATNAATKLVSDKVTVVLGHTCSGATKSALPIYKEANMIVMSPSATSPELTQNGEYPTFFRTIAPDDQQARLGVQFALEKLQLKKIALLHDKGDYGKGYAEFARQFIKQSGRAAVVMFEGITPGAMDYSAVVQKLRRSGADGIMFGGYHPEASKLISQIRKKRIKLPFISDDGVKDNAFIKVAGKNAEGVYATSSKDVSSLPMYQEAVARHKEEFGTEPGAFYKEAYSAAIALLNAIERAGDTAPEKIKAALHSKAANTPVGNIQFSPTGEAEGVGFSMYQVQNGQYVELQ